MDARLHQNPFCITSDHLEETTGPGCATIHAGFLWEITTQEVKNKGGKETGTSKFLPGVLLEVYVNVSVEYIQPLSSPHFFTHL
jgi:hypothetical protein